MSGFRIQSTRIIDKFVGEEIYSHKNVYKCHLQYIHLRQINFALILLFRSKHWLRRGSEHCFRDTELSNPRHLVVTFVIRDVHVTQVGGVAFTVLTVRQIVVMLGVRGRSSGRRWRRRLVRCRSAAGAARTCLRRRFREQVRLARVTTGRSTTARRWCGEARLRQTRQLLIRWGIVRVACIKERQCLADHLHFEVQVAHLRRFNRFLELFLVVGGERHGQVVRQFAFTGVQVARYVEVLLQIGLLGLYVVAFKK